MHRHACGPLPGPVLGPQESQERCVLLSREGNQTSAACKDRACPPAVEGVVPRDDVGAVFACQELDAVVEGLHGG